MPDSDEERTRVQIAVPISAHGFSTEPTLPAPPARLGPGALIEQYELIRELGRGGMGVVYAARDRKLGRRVAIKFLHDVTTEVAQRFLVEARATAKCNHENIVIIYEVNVHDATPYMVLELLDGHPLRELLGPYGQGYALPATRVVELVVPVARALARAHAAGIVHRDLKPENIQVTGAGQVKVLDFGVAIANELTSSGRRSFTLVDDPLLTDGGALVGTLPYMSPEQVAGGKLDHRSDLFAIGIIMFEMLSGKHPVEPLSTEALFENLVSDAPLRSARTIPGVPAQLADLVDQCLVKDRQHRMPDANELVRRLEALLPDRRGRRLEEGESPYPGLSAFQEADADRFFGRARDVARVSLRLREQPLTAVVGPSGVGKSSFIRAGVIPALKSSGERWEFRTLRPGRHPLAALAAILDEDRREASFVGELDRDAVVDRIRTEPGYLGVILRDRARRLGCKIVLYIDQFEELYTLVADPLERYAFTAALRGIADDATAPLRVIVSMRSDLLDRVGEDARFLEDLIRNIAFLAPPDREGLREALVAPLDMVGYRFESPTIIEDVVAALAETPGALPLLQFAAGKLWDARSREQRMLSVESYRAIGGIAGALASHADQVIASMPSASRRLARMVLRQLVTPERTRAIAERADLLQLGQDPAATSQVIDHLLDARLLVIQTRDSDSTVELVHESLIMGWPTLRRWLDEDAEDVQFRNQLTLAAKQWEARDRASGFLWQGDATKEARRWFDAQPRELAERERAFLHAVFALDTRGRRRRRIAGIAVFALLSTIAIVASAAYVRVRAAKLETERANADLTAAQVARDRADHLAAAAQQQLGSADAARTIAQDQVAQKNLTIEDKNRLLEKEKAAALEVAEAAKVAEQNAQLSQKKAELLADKLKSANDQLQDTTEALQREKAKVEQQLAEERNKHKGIAKELK